MLIQVSHCRAAYDYLHNINIVEPLPTKLDTEQETAGGIMAKLRNVVDSDYFKALPAQKTIA